MELKKDKLKEMKRREGAVVRHVSGISCKTDITELAHSTESPFFDPSSVSLSGVPSDS